MSSSSTTQTSLIRIQQIMYLLTTALPIAIGLEHIYILTLEMFLWQKPLGLKTFRNTPASAAATASLAKNMGLYNGFLAAAVLGSTLVQEYNPVQVFPLACVAVAGIYGGWSVSGRIFWVQGVPALVAIAGILGSR